MQRRYHTLVVLSLTLLAIVGMVSASVSPLASPARAQDVTSLLTPPAFENQRFVIGTHPIPDPTQDGPPTFAISDIPDPTAFPTTTVRVHNYEGRNDAQRFWLSVRIRQLDPGVDVIPQPGYAEMGLIAPGGDAEYTVTFPDSGSAQVEFEVDGSTDEAAMLTILQFALDSGLTAANITGLGSHSQELGLALAEVVAEQYLHDLSTLTPCANAVATLQRGLTDQEQFTSDVQGCLESPIWQVSVDQVLARVAERDWFQQSLNAAGMAVPQLGIALKAVEATQFATRVWTMYDKFHPEVPGAMVGTVVFMTIDTVPQDILGAATAVPEGAALALVDRLAALPPEAVLDLLLTSQFASDELPTFLAMPIQIEEKSPETYPSLEGAIGGVLVAEGNWPPTKAIDYTVYPTASEARSRIDADLAALGQDAEIEDVSINLPNEIGFPGAIIRYSDQVDNLGVAVMVPIGNVVTVGWVHLDETAADWMLADEQALTLARAGVIHMDQLMTSTEEEVATPEATDSSISNEQTNTSQFEPREIIDLGPGHAYAINESGQIVGESGDAPVLWEGNQIIELATLGGRYSSAIGINEAGLIVGNSEVADESAQSAVLWEDSRIVDLGTLGIGLNSANDINEAGQIVGVSRTAEFEDHAVLWEAGQIIDLGTLGGTFTEANTSFANGINDAGQIVGSAQTADGDFHAVLWDAGQIIDLGTLDERYSEAFDINESGQIVGRADNADGERHAVLWEEGRIIDLGTIGGAGSQAKAINDAGQIVGSSDTADGGFHAVLWEAGQIIDLGTLGGATSMAFSINNAGQIVGLADSPDGETHAVLWKIPPASEVPQTAPSPEKTVDAHLPAPSAIPLGMLDGAQSSSAHLINDSGQVVGIARVADDDRRVVVWNNGEIIDLGNSGSPEGVNNDQIVGNVRVDGVNTRAVIWESGQTTDIGTLGGEWSNAAAINDAGQVVGYSFTADGAQRAFRWQDGRMTDLGTLGGLGSSAEAINEAGQIVGSADDATDNARPVLWTDGEIIDLGTLGGDWGVALGINDSGQIVGYAETDLGDIHAFLWQDGQMIDLGGLDGTRSDAYAINNAGQIVGDAESADGVRHAVLWQDGQLVVLDTLGGTESYAVDINNSGQIVGRATSVAGTGYPLLWETAS